MEQSAGQSVAETLWVSAGRPIPNPTMAVGTCALTGITGPVWPISDAVSGNFTDWAQLPWLDQQSPVLGAAAIHAYRAWGPVRIQGSRWKDGGLAAIAVRPGELLEVRRGQLPPAGPDVAVAVPLSRQRHCVPYARPGCWATEGAVIPVGLSEWAAVHGLNTLRQLGLGEGEAREPHPRAGAHARLGITLNTLWDMWAHVHTLRQQPPLLEMAIRLTRQEKP